MARRRFTMRRGGMEMTTVRVELHFTREVWDRIERHARLRGQLPHRWLEDRVQISGAVWAPLPGEEGFEPGE